MDMETVTGPPLRPLVGAALDEHALRLIAVTAAASAALAGNARLTRGLCCIVGALLPDRWLCCRDYVKWSVNAAASPSVPPPSCSRSPMRAVLARTPMPSGGGTGLMQP